MTAIPRRRLIAGAITGGIAAAAGAAIGLEASNRSTPAEAEPAGSVAVPFHGTTQAGVVTPQQKEATIVSFDSTVDSQDELADLFRTITDRARFLCIGGRPLDTGISAPPTDSGVVGPDVRPDRLTVTVGVGASLFDQRYGLAARKPAKLKPMTTFPNDALKPELCHGDISVQLCADNRDTVVHALRDLARHTRGGMQIRWRADGFLSPSRPDGAPRNLMGFKDGTANPAASNVSLMKQLVWSGKSEPAWAAGGSYQVVRLIRMLVEFWDRVAMSEQENMFGRRRDTGAPLDGNHETDIPNFAADPIGSTIPLTSHIRRANPRTAKTASSVLLRRPYNYDNGVDEVGNLDMGMLFVCYQQDLVRQFEAVQTRLVDEPLVDYISPYGGGYFYVLPGVRDRADFLGRGLFRSEGKTSS
ncbi:iron uptake transporter deferrochelatase/peroxidase subunit [Fodinicola acaciae]|uniref:iron uptake transporter deferrochelatase/peroxidase subunit n=1 Tax=Fodinicola acaciae TaxID=2681555 RepID=UPI0013D0F459|nr:iron uptake transporter deferrochelatase/peroxidase subunit [Fodinicola acaciae]